MDYKERIQASIEYIEGNLKEEISLDNLAKQTFLSKYHYHRLFHELVGETVMTYVRKRRLNEAAKELLEGETKIVDIALKYQFSSQESFSRAFKKMFQVSPGEFRRAKVNVLQYRKVDIFSRKVAKPSMINSLYKVA